MKTMGIDIGKSGGIVVLDEDCNVIAICRFCKSTFSDITTFIKDWKDAMCVVEHIHSSPQMGVVSAFTFGKQYGIILGILTAYGVYCDLATPQTWKRALGLLKTDKKAAQQYAQKKLNKRLTMDIADAACIALYSYNHFKEREQK